jgi:release factor glutamine methyltransferase
MPKTYNELYLNARRAFREAGISSYNLEARLILCEATGKSLDKLMRDMQFYTSDAVTAEVEQLVQRRLAGEPVAYITGKWEFYGLPMEVTPDVLIPRMDTELLAETAIRALKDRQTNARVLDLCTGSGCIGCAIASALPAVRVVMADVSPQALHVAKRNVLLNNLNPRVTCIEADATKAPPMMMGSFDLVASNPPYIPTTDIWTLDPSVRDHEPLWALDGGADGLDFYRAILKHWKGVIRDGGTLLFEVGIHQAEDVKKLMLLAGFKSIESAFDTGGVERVIIGKV